MTSQLGFSAGGGIFVKDAFGGELVNVFLGLAEFFFNGFGAVGLFGGGEKFFDLGFQGAFIGAVAQAVFGVLPDSFFRGERMGH